MIDTPGEPMTKRLSRISCGRCGWPVSYMNKRVAGAEAGGMCTNCTKDESGRRLVVFTYYAVITADDDRDRKV